LTAVTATALAHRLIVVTRSWNDFQKDGVEVLDSFSGVGAAELQRWLHHPGRQHARLHER
jgi:hypothetical protein